MKKRRILRRMGSREMHWGNHFRFGVLVRTALVLVLFFIAQTACERSATAASTPVLLYHRFGPAVSDGMTITTPVFASHLEYLKSNGYTVIPLRQMVDAVSRRTPLPAKSVVIVVDDGHKTVYTEMLPLIQKYRVPVTLFIYPSAISNASYAMSWEQLRALHKTGLFDMQSHTYWHPNFRKERKKLSASEFDSLVAMQLGKSKSRLEKEFGTKVDMLAWPFGIYDDDLTARAKAAGYIAAFTIEGGREKDLGNPMKIPRYLLTNADKGKRFERIVSGQDQGGSQKQ